MAPQTPPPHASRRIAANAALRAGGEVVAKVASLLLFVVMARELGTQGFGAFNFALSLATVLIAAMAAIVNLGGYDPETRLAVYLIGAGVAVENLGRSWHFAMQGFERLALVSPSLILQRTFTAGIPRSRRSARASCGAAARVASPASSSSATSATARSS